jgi:hypothetical protein
MESLHVCMLVMLLAVGASQAFGNITVTDDRSDSLTLTRPAQRINQPGPAYHGIAVRRGRR